MMLPCQIGTLRSCASSVQRRARRCTDEAHDLKVPIWHGNIITGRKCFRQIHFANELRSNQRHKGTTAAAKQEYCVLPRLLRLARPLDEADCDWVRIFKDSGLTEGLGICK